MSGSLIKKLTCFTASGTGIFVLACRDNSLVDRWIVVQGFRIGGLTLHVPHRGMVELQLDVGVRGYISSDVLRHPPSSHVNF